MLNKLVFTQLTVVFARKQIIWFNTGSMISRNKIYEIFIATLLGVVLIGFSNNPTNVFANPTSNYNGPEYTKVQKVTATNGLNVRDENCKVKDTIALGTILYKAEDIQDRPQKTIDCTIKGQKKTLTFVIYGMSGGNEDSSLFTEQAPSTTGGFASSEFFSQLEYVDNFDVTITNQASIANFQIDATLGLNLRDKNCKRLKTLPHKTNLWRRSDTPFNNIKCKVNGVQYSMSQVMISPDGRGDIGFVATLYLK